MPLAFPSHQGLILPLWRRFPRAIDGVALCVGAAMPDVVDGLAWGFRGELGQWLGHSLIGIGVCVPIGLCWYRSRGGSRRERGWRASTRGRPPPLARPRGRFARDRRPLHIAFDLVTHGNFLLLWPWVPNESIFPDWWYHAWASIPLPVYREPYPIAPHTLSWIVLTLIGVVLFVRCTRAAKP